MIWHLNYEKLPSETNVIVLTGKVSNQKRKWNKIVSQNCLPFKIALPAVPSVATETAVAPIG